MKYFKMQLYDTESEEQVQMETEAHRIENLISWGRQHSEIDLLEEFYFQLNNELEKSDGQKSEESGEKDS
jgi:protein subunit release factor B